MALAFVDRHPTPQEVEKIRLILSTFQDGTGMLKLKEMPEGVTLPGWRDFERTVALAFGGDAPENKAVFDVLLTHSGSSSAKFGLSCKMRGELNRLDRDGRVTIEVSNSAQKFWEHLNAQGFNQTNYKDHPHEVGVALVELVEQWHLAAASLNVDLAKSCYLVLSWNRQGWYQLHQFALPLPDPDTLNWQFPFVRQQGVETQAKRLKGSDNTGVLFEWYGESGGQLKYYPLATDALWQSERFRLEPLAQGVEYGILAKAAAYFPDKWQWADGKDEEGEKN